MTEVLYSRSKLTRGVFSKTGGFAALRVTAAAWTVIVACDGYALGGDLPETVQGLKDRADQIYVANFQPANCNREQCEVVSKPAAIQIGALIERADTVSGYGVSCEAEDGATYPLRLPEFSSYSKVTLPFNRDTLGRVFGREAQKTIQELEGLAEKGSAEISEIHSEVAFSEMDFRQAVRSLKAECRRNVAPHSATQLVSERSFGKPTLRVTMKGSMDYEELRARLLELNKTLPPEFKASIGLGQNRERLLVVESTVPRLVSFRSTPIGPLRENHPEWFN